MDTLKYYWLMMSSLGGAVVSFYHVTLYIVYKVKPSVKALDFAKLDLDLD